MERTIEVVIRVNDEDHAKLIKEDILKAIKQRTVEYHVTEPYSGSKFIRDYLPEDIRSQIDE